MKQEKMYHVAIRQKDAADDFYWNHKDYMFVECKIDCKGKYWLADPFLFEKDGVTYIFYEAMDLVTKLGKIGYSIYRNDGTCSDPKIVIDEPFHMSFPNIFEYKGEIYIMPESCGDWRVKLYKAKQFPDKWEPANILLPDVYACDNIFIEEGEKRWLLANEMYHHPPVDSFGSCWVKNVLYMMENLSIVGEGTIVGEGDFGIRNAGKTFHAGDKHYRIGQDCRNKQYGRGIALFEINSVVPYRETMLWSMGCKEFAPHIDKTGKEEIMGVHTYNSSEHYEIIDFSQMKKMASNIRLKRFLLHLSKFATPLFNQFK